MKKTFWDKLIQCQRFTLDQRVRQLQVEHSAYTRQTSVVAHKSKQLLARPAVLVGIFTLGLLKGHKSSGSKAEGSGKSGGQSTTRSLLSNAMSAASLVMHTKAAKE